MKVSDLIAKLQTANPDATVIIDAGRAEIEYGYFKDLVDANVMNEAIIVAEGIGYKISDQNLGAGRWIEANPWEGQSTGLPLNGIPSLYIGTGKSITGVKWKAL